MIIIRIYSDGSIKIAPIEHLEDFPDYVEYRLEESGCGNHSCCVEKPTGMATNGPCDCLWDAVPNTKHRLLVKKHLFDIKGNSNFY